MGQITRKVVGDVELHPRYQEFIIEFNEIGHAHIHHGNIRLDMDRADYNKFYDAMITAYRKLNGL